MFYQKSSDIRTSHPDQVPSTDISAAFFCALQASQQAGALMASGLNAGR